MQSACRNRLHQFLVHKGKTLEGVLGIALVMRFVLLMGLILRFTIDREDYVGSPLWAAVQFALAAFCVYVLLLICLRVLKSPLFLSGFGKLLQVSIDIVAFSVFYCLTKDAQSEIYLAYFLPLLVAAHCLRSRHTVVFLLFTTVAFGTTLLGIATLFEPYPVLMFLRVFLPREFLLATVTLTYWFCKTQLQALTIEERSSLDRVSQTIVSTLELDEVLSSIMEQATKLLKAEAGSVLLLDDKSGELVFEAVVGAVPERTKGLRFPSTLGIAGWVLRERQPQLVPDVSQDPRFYPGIDSVTGLVTKSLLCVPLEVKGKVIGVLEVINKTRGNFREDDLRLLTHLAPSAAIAIENARLHQREQKRAAQLAVVNQVARQAASILDLDQLLQEMVTAIQQGFDYYNVALYLLDETASELEMLAIAGGFEDVVAPDYCQAVGAGMIGWTAETGQPLLANDVRQEPRYILGFLEEPLTEAELCMPLKLAKEVIGVLDIQSTQLNAFDETDLMAMKTLADQIAMAIENARLFGETSRRFEETMALYQTSLDITAQLEMTELLESIVERAATLLGAEAGGIFLYDSDRDELTLVISYGYTDKYVGTTLKPGEGMAGKVFQSGESMIIDDYQSWEGRSAAFGADPPFTAVLEVPLKWRDRISGVLVINGDAQKRTFNQDDIWLATLFANQATVAMENARLYEEVWQELTERKRAEETLAQEQHLLHAIMDNSPDAIYFKDTDSRFIRINKAHAERWFGLNDTAEAIGKTDFDFFSEEHAQQAYRDEQEIVRTGRPLIGIEEKETWPDRPNTWVLTTKMPLRDAEGRIMGTFGITRDITERKRAQQALRESGERYRTIFETTGTATVIIEEDMTISLANAEFESLSGYSKEELEGNKSWTEFVVADDLERMKEYHQLRRIDPRAAPQCYEFRFIDRHGNVKNVFLSIDMIPGTKKSVASLLDITERKRAGEVLERRAAQLALINDIGGEISAVLDLDSVFDRAACLVQESFGFHHVALFIMDREREEAVLRAVAGRYAARIPEGYRLKLAEGMVGWTATHGVTRLANDVRTDPHHVRDFSDAMTKAELSVPIRASGKTIGVLDVQSPQLDAFEQSDVLVMETLADQIAVAIENARLFQETQQRIQELTTLQQVSVKLTAALSKPKDLLKMIVDSAVSTIPVAERGIVHLVDPASQELWPEVWSGIDRAAIGGTRMKVGEGVAGYAIDVGELVNVPDTSLDQRFQLHPQSNGRCKSLLVAPMLIGREKIGTISVDSTKANAFTSDDEKLLTALATHAAYAIQNARLFNRTVTYVATLEKLAEFSKKLIAYTDLDELFTFAAQQGAQIFSAEDCSLFVKDKLKQTTRMVASSCVPLDIFPEKEAPISSEPGAGLTQFVAATGQILNFFGDTYKEHPAWKGEFRDHLKYLPSGACHSLLIGPLEGSEGEIVGVVKLENKSGEDAASGFSEFEEKMFRTFASQVGIAIERAQLFQRIDELARKSERERLREDLHDAMNLVHALIMLEAERILELVQAREYQKVETSLRALWKNARFVNFDQLGRLLEDMRDPTLADKGLAVALQNYVGRIKAFEVHLDIKGRGRLPFKIEHILYRIAQQALGNVAKHARLNEVENGKAQVTLAIESENVTLTIADNGVGFDAEKELERRDALGLSVMRRWARSIDAQFEIISRPGKGTTVRVVAPFEEEKEVRP